MKAALLRAADAEIEYADFAEPVASEGREIVDLVAAGIHPVVRSLAIGRHYGSTHLWPCIPGVDAVARNQDGTLVFTGHPAPPYGTLAERISVPSRLRMPLPDGADPASIAGGLNPGLSSWLPIKARIAEAGALQTVLILGVTGVAGQLAAQNARLCGATRVIGAGRNLEALARATTAGANAVVALEGEIESDAAAIAAAIGPAASTLILDFVWGPVAEATFRALGRQGLDEDSADIAYVQIGAGAGADASLPAALLRSRRLRLSGSGLGSASVASLMAEVPVYMQLIADGRVEVPIQTFALSDIAAAWRAAARSGARVVVRAER